MDARGLLRLGLLAAGGCLVLALAPASALADTATSSNWSGYAAHRSGLKFRRVSASWTQPAATCRRGQYTYSSFWVGLGGYSSDSSGLEQIGTELDCTASGRHRSSVWYELVPAPSKPISMTVRTGDHLSASVTVVGQQVVVRLSDHTRKESFTKKLTTRSIDVTSADWIAEAPSTCDYTGACQPLPLADFGAAHFTAGTAETTSGQQGPISSPAWSHTRIVLSQPSSPFASLSAQRTSTPSALQSGGSTFVVRYGQASPARSRALRASSAGTAGAIQPGGVRR
jgi:hypothetical protein